MKKVYDESRYINLFKTIDKSTGEITKESKWSGSMLGDDYFVLYKKSIDLLLHDPDAPESALKVFMKLCTMQTFEAAVVVSRKFLMDDLGCTRKTLWRSLSFLKERAYIMETKVNGYSAFVINPDVSNCGKSAINSKRKMFAENEFGNKPGFKLNQHIVFNRKEKLEGFDAHS